MHGGHYAARRDSESPVLPLVLVLVLVDSTAPAWLYDKLLNYANIPPPLQKPSLPEDSSIEESKERQVSVLGERRISGNAGS